MEVKLSSFNPATCPFAPPNSAFVLIRLLLLISCFSYFYFYRLSYFYRVSCSTDFLDLPILSFLLLFSFLPTLLFAAKLLISTNPLLSAHLLLP